MQQHRTAAPGALAAMPASRLDAIRAIVVEHQRPAFGLAPTDGEAGGTGTATAAPGAPAGDPLGLAPGASTSDSNASAPQVTYSVNSGQPAGQAPAAAGTPPVTPPAAAPPAAPAPVTAVPTPPPAGQQPGQQGQPQGGAEGGGPGALADAPLESFPPEIRAYIANLRKENGDNRMKAKTAEEAAASAATAAQQRFIDNMLKAAGVITDVDDQGNPVGAAAQLTPEQRLEQATAQVAAITGERDASRTDVADARRELAIWKGAHAHDASAQRLADSRSFMRSIAGLDPSADDFEAKLATAIGAAVESDASFRNTQPPGAAAQIPQVPSGGDFGGGPAQPDATPTTVDGFRELLTKSRRAARGEL